jgi:subtilisin family serine protease
MKKFLPLALLATVIFLAGVWALGGWRSAGSKETAGEVVSEIPDSEKAAAHSPDSASHPATPAAPFPLVGSPANQPLTPAARQLAPLLATPVPLRDGGTRREFQVSTTELSIRTPGGSSRILTIPAAASPQEFASAIEKARSEHGTEPELVLYPTGFPQNESTRRIATREVVITAPSRAEADAIASASGLTFKKAPVFAPNSFVYEAASPVDALATQARSDDSVEVTPLLASLASKKAMPNDPYIHLQWHLKYQAQQGSLPGSDIQVESLWNYPSTSTANSTRGRGVVIGIVDDGLEWSHPDLAPNVLKNLQYDWNGKDTDPSPDYDDWNGLREPDNHGTACAGVAAARGNNRIGVSGVAPEASLVGLRLTAHLYPKTDLDEAEAMTWKIPDIHVLSNSWGPSDNGYTLRAPAALMRSALKHAADFGRNGKGTIITFAGGNGRNAILTDSGNPRLDQNGNPIQLGNDNSNYDGYANSIYTIAVAAIDSQLLQADYSEPGANIVVAAPSLGAPPSLGIMTTDNIGLYGNNPGFSYFDFANSGDVTQNFNGTSASCPVVSGVVALMLERKPGLGWRDVQEILMRSATKVNPADPGWKTPVAPANINHHHSFGAGLVNATAAVALSGSWTNLAPQTSTSAQLVAPQSIAPGQTVSRTLHVTESLRAEHVTLGINLPGIRKGDLRIELTSPIGTTSTLCEPHFDTVNQFADWTFMSVRHWGETTPGFWKVTITNNGTASGNLTAATVTIFGTPSASPQNPLPVVDIEARRTYPTSAGSFESTPVGNAFAGTPITLRATATDMAAGNGTGTIDKVEFFSNNGTGPVSIGNATPLGNNTYSLTWAPAVPGDYILTATATDGGSPPASATSSLVRISIAPPPFVAWDFDTLEPDSPFEFHPEQKIPLQTAIQSLRQYSANFRVGSSIIAAWEVTGVSNNSTLAPALTAHSANASALTHGPGGIRAFIPAQPNTWGGTLTGNSTDAATAIARNATATFEIQPEAGNSLSLHSLDAHNFRRSATGPGKILWQYRIGTGNFTNIGLARDIGQTFTSAGNQQPSLPLDQIPALQNISDSTRVTLRMVLFGTQGQGEWFLNNQSQYDLVLRAPPPRILFDGTLGSSKWDSANGEIWTDQGTTVNSLADSNPFATNTALQLRGGKNLAANNKSLVFQLDMTKARRLQISYAALVQPGGFTTHTWEYFNSDTQSWERIPLTDGSLIVDFQPPGQPLPSGFSFVEMDIVPGAGFNGRSDARVRLTVNGATAINGTNLLDNIRFNATVDP